MRLSRLIVDGPADGAWNMAVDDVLLTVAAQRGEATLRFYGWSKPTLSLGYFQPYQSRDEHAPSCDCSIVRRASGGGAILHDRELTYALALPVEFWPERDHVRLYAVMHDLLCDALETLGVRSAARFGVQTAAESAQTEPFLCFERRTEYDVVLGAAKIAGSAQRKRRGAVLQHGSVLLARSPFAPSLSGIEEVSGLAIAPERLIEAWLPLLAAKFDTPWLPEHGFAEAEAGLVQSATEKFAAPAWLQRR